MRSSEVVQFQGVLSVLSAMKVPHQYLYWLILPIHWYHTRWKIMQTEDPMYKNSILAINCVLQEMWYSAFGCLKARFSVLQKETDINPSDLQTVIFACSVLHTFCEVNMKSISDDWVRAVIEDDYGSQLSNQCTPIQNNEAEGKYVRWVFTKYFDP